MSSDDAAQFLAGSPDRRQVLRHLVDNPASPAELADALSLSRRSIQRHLGQFTDRGWAEKNDGAYHLTVTGELVIEEQTAHLATLERLETVGPFFRHLPDRQHAPDPRWLDSATIVTATAANPQAPVQHYLETVRGFDADRIRMLSPVLSRLYHEAHAKLALDGVHTELVLSAATIERARELNPTEFKLVVSVDVLDLYRHPEDVAVGLTLGTDTLLMGVYDADGQLEACVESSNPEFLAWAADLFERYRERADPVEPPFSLPFKLGP